MEKEKILELAKNILNQPYSEEYLDKLAQKNPKKFLNNLASLDERQIKYILREHPGYANTTHDGWHSLHYACMLNDQHILGIFFQKAIDQGLSHIPKTEASKKNIGEGVPLLNFCVANNCEKSFAKVLTFLSNPEEQDFNWLLRYGLSYHSPKVIPIIQKIMGEEAYQQEMLSYFSSSWVSSKEVRRSHFYDTFSDTFKCKIERFEEYGIDFNYRNPEGKNYFTAALSAIAENVYNFWEYDEKDERQDRFKKCLDFFLDKGFDFDSPDGENNSPRTYISKIVEGIYSSYRKEKMEEYIAQLETKSLDNKLPKNNLVQPKRIKV